MWSGGWPYYYPRQFFDAPPEAKFCIAHGIGRKLTLKVIYVDYCGIKAVHVLIDILVSNNGYCGRTSQRNSDRASSTFWNTCFSEEKKTGFPSFETLLNILCVKRPNVKHCPQARQANMFIFQFNERYEIFILTFLYVPNLSVEYCPRWPCSDTRLFRLQQSGAESKHLYLTQSSHNIVKLQQYRTWSCSTRCIIFPRKVAYPFSTHHNTQRLMELDYDK